MYRTSYKTDIPASGVAHRTRHSRSRTGRLGLVWGGLLLSAVTLHCSPESPPAGIRLLEPAGHIGDEAIDESSGIVYLDGAYYTHNDSGDDPVVYRSSEFTFPAGGTEHLPVPGADAIDWEDITALAGDLILGDIGDNRRERPHLTLYRTRYRAPTAGEATGRVALVATYPFRYPDARHDGEALFAIDDTLYIVSKAREEKVTHVYRFDQLTDAADLPLGEVNVPRLIARLEIGEGEQITAGAYHPGTGRVVLLTYTHLLQYPRDVLEGEPQRRTLVAARQCEAICFRGEDLIITNEQREVFEVPDFFELELGELMPRRGKAVWPRWNGPVALKETGEADWRKALRNLALHNAWAGEEVAVLVAGDRLLVRGKLFVEEGFRPTTTSADVRAAEQVTDEAHAADPTAAKAPATGTSSDPEDAVRPRLGSAVLIALAPEALLMLDGSETIFGIGRNLDGTFGVWRLDLRVRPFEILPLADAPVQGAVADGRFDFEASLPLPENIAGKLEAGFRFDLRGLRLHEPDVRFSGMDLFTIERPYTWGLVQVED